MTHKIYIRFEYSNGTTMSWEIKMYLKFIIWSYAIKPIKKLFSYISNKHWYRTDKNPHYFCYKVHLFGIKDGKIRRLDVNKILYKLGFGKWKKDE